MRAVLVVNGAVLALYVLPVLGPESTAYALNSLSMIPVAFLGILAPWVGLPPVESSRERVFWGLWSGAFGVILLVRLVYLVSPEIDSVASGALSTDLLYGTFYILLVLAVLVRPDRQGSIPMGRTPSALETAGTAVFTVALVVYFVFLSRSQSPEEYRSFVPSLLLYWTLGLFLLFSFIYLRGTSPSPRWRVLFAWLAVAPLCWSVTDVLEAIYYMNVASGTPEALAWEVPASLDWLWYVPWAAATLAGRMRADPWPLVLGRGAADAGRAELSRSLGRPGWLVVVGLTLPIIHLGADLLGLLDPATRASREALVLASTAILLVLAFVHQKVVERKTLALNRRSQEMEEQQRLLSAAVEQSPDAILIADAGRVVRYVNPAWEGADPRGREAPGKPLEEALPPALEVGWDNRMRAALEKGEAWDGRHRAANSDGQEREEIISLSPARDGNGGVSFWVVVRNDVTYLSQLERQLAQSQKMEALGTLAGGIAHDFNNILGAIYGYGELLNLEMDPESQSYQDLQGLLNAAARAAELVSQILTFSRQGEVKKEPLDMDSVVREAVALLRATLPSTIRIREEFGPGLGRVLGVRHQIHQMILNLGSNASHAMAETGGTLEIGLQRIELDPLAAGEKGLPQEGFYCRLTVRDSGTGMDEATLNRIFEPFFTTKEVGRGTGLGLSVVHGAVKAHGGAIAVESRPGEGTLFEILLPCTAQEGVEPLDGEAEPPLGNGKRVLLVDDEPDLVSLTGQMLRSLGYEVVAFNRSVEALEFLKAGTGEIDGIISDQTMPEITGLELARRAREMRPGLPILLVTGYSEALSPERVEDAGVSRTLMKPYTRRALGLALGNILA